MHVQPTRLHHLLAAVGKELCGEGGGARARCHDILHVTTPRMFGRHFVQHQRAGAGDHGQQIVEVVRDATCQPSHRFQPLRLLQLLLHHQQLPLGLELRGDVGERPDPLTHRTVVVQYRHGVHFHLAPLPVTVPQTVRGRERSDLRDGTLPFEQQMRGVIRVQEVVILSLHAIGRETGECRPLVHVGGRAIGQCRPDDVRLGLHEREVARLAMTQTCIGCRQFAGPNAHEFVRVLTCSRQRRLRRQALVRLGV